VPFGRSDSGCYGELSCLLRASHKGKLSLLLIVAILLFLPNGLFGAVRQGGHDEKENSSFLTFDLGTLHPLVFNARPSIVAYINLAIIYAVLQLV